MLHVAALTRVARIGPSPSGKAPGFGPGIRGFESLRPSQVLHSNRLVRSGWAVYFALMLFFYGMITGFIIGSLYVDEFIERKEKDGN